MFEGNFRLAAAENVLVVIVPVLCSGLVLAASVLPDARANTRDSDGDGAGMPVMIWTLAVLTLWMVVRNIPVFDFLRAG
jgi:hypothetical protein